MVFFNCLVCLYSCTANRSSELFPESTASVFLPWVPSDSVGAAAYAIYHRHIDRALADMATLGFADVLHLDIHGQGVAPTLCFRGTASGATADLQRLYREGVGSPPLGSVAILEFSESTTLKTHLEVT